MLETSDTRVSRGRDISGHDDECVQPRVLISSRFDERVKRAIDVVGATVLMAGLAPVLAACMLVVRVESAGPVLFRQKRVGRDGRVFAMLKFRTMYVDADQALHQSYATQFVLGKASPQVVSGKSVFKLARDPRVTCGGLWMRRFSLDELPQLINVLRGEMSLVGPRPALPYEVDHYSPRALARLEAVPGITGLWQVSGRSRTTFEEMVELDLEYIRRRSVFLDLQILLRTFGAVLWPDGY